MRAVKSKDIVHEVVLLRLVRMMEYLILLHVRSPPGKPELVFPRLQKIILVNSCFWQMHKCGRCRIPATRRDYWTKKLERNAVRDKASQRALRKLGWRLLVVWECQIRAERIEGLESKLRRFLEGDRLYSPAKQRKKMATSRIGGEPD